MTQEFNGGSDLPRIFANEKTRIRWETLQRVRRVSESLPPGTPHDLTVAIDFHPEYKDRGWEVMLYSGSILSESDNGEVIHRVPQRTCTILDRLGIPYTVLSKPMRRLGVALGLL